MQMKKWFSARTFKGGCFAGLLVGCIIGEAMRMFAVSDDAAAWQAFFTFNVMQILAAVALSGLRRPPAFSFGFAAGASLAISLLVTIATALYGFVVMSLAYILATVAKGVAHDIYEHFTSSPE